MKSDELIAVCSRSFSKDKFLRSAIQEKYSNVKFNDEGISLKGESLIQFLQGCSKAITALETVDDSILASLPNLKVIGKYGIGLDMLDLDSLQRNNVKLGWTAGVNKRSVAEIVISNSINLLRGIQQTGDEIAEGLWKQYKGRQLSSITFGIIGIGNVGQEVIKLLSPFGPRIIFHDIKDYPDFEKDHDIQKCSFDDIIKQADVISIHVPKSNETINMINTDVLKKMKLESIIINTSRGGIVNEEDLIEALQDKRILGAALDVFKEEPNFNKEMIKNHNIIMTSHIGGSSLQAIKNMGLAAIKGLDNFKDAQSYK